MVRGLTWSRKASTASSPPRTMRRLRPLLWEEGAQVMSEEELMLCALITDARRSDSETPVISPGGYMRGMVEACLLGNLNLAGSLIGLNERRLAEEQGGGQ